MSKPLPIVYRRSTAESVPEKGRAYVCLDRDGRARYAVRIDVVVRFYPNSRRRLVTPVKRKAKA